MQKVAELAERPAVCCSARVADPWLHSRDCPVLNAEKLPRDHMAFLPHAQQFLSDGTRSKMG